MQLLLKRIPMLLFQYVVVTFIYWYLGKFVDFILHSFGYVMRAFKKGDPIAMFSWYVIVILLLYIGFLLLLFIFRKHHVCIVVGGFVLCVLWAVFSCYLGYGTYWCNTVIAFALGMLWALVEKRVLPLIKKKYSSLLYLLIVTFLVMYSVNKISYYYSIPMQVLISWGVSLVFSILLIVILLKVKISNVCLRFLGRISFELYMIHGVYIQLFRSLTIYIKNDALWTAAVFGASILSAFLLHLVFGFISKQYGKLVGRLMNLGKRKLTSGSKV